MVSDVEQTALTCLTENLWGYIRGCATYGEDWFSHNHGKAKVSQFQSTDASGHMLYLMEGTRKTRHRQEQSHAQRQS